MSEWRRKAKSEFPDRTAAVEHAGSLNDLWFELLVDFQAAYRDARPRKDFSDRVWAFASWCFDRRRNRSVRNAVAVCFYEHLPHFGPARIELPHRISPEDFDSLTPAFRVTLTDAEFDTFAAEFHSATGRPRSDLKALRNRKA